MDVTRSNFSKVFKQLEKVISESSFLAIDGEFTGLIDGGPDAAAYDTYSEYYRKLKNGSLNFLFIQFGLCAFKYDTEKNKWSHKAYNFYTFPRPWGRKGGAGSADSRFLCQASSMDFLAGNGFDFNKLFREGVSYLSLPEEQRLRARLEEKHAAFARNGSPATPGGNATVPVPEDQAEFLEDVMTRLSAFASSESPGGELSLPRCNAFQRKLVYQAAQERFPTELRLETRVAADNARTFVAMRMGSEEERKQLETERNEKEVEELDEAVGFSKVIRLLVSCGKLIVGHNMLLDMMHVLQQFCAPVPDDYAEFKVMLHDSFPRLLDTKCMALSAPFKDTIRSTMLADLHGRLTEPPFHMPQAECETLGEGYPSLTEKYHEAGYDALVTGLCAIAMATHLDPKAMHPDISTLPRLNKYLNKLLLFRMQDFGYMDLAANDPVLPRDHVFHVTFPKEWKQSDIVKLFQPVGPVFVSWLDETSAFVALNEREKGPSALSALPRSPRYRVSAWASWQRAGAGASALPAQGVPASPSAGQRKRRAADQLPVQTQRQRALPAKESKFPRRSIDPIAEETEPPSPRNPVGGKASAAAAAKSHFEESDVWG